MNSKQAPILPWWLTERIGNALPPSAADDALARVGRALQSRTLQSANQEAGLITVRAADTPWTAWADGLQGRELYRCASAQNLRPGEPTAVELWHLDAGFEVSLPVDDAHDIEWLLVRGAIELDGRAYNAMCGVRDAHGVRAKRLRSVTGAVLYRRLGVADQTGAATLMSTLAAPRWEPMMEGVERLPLWSDGVQEAYIIRARAGAAAPAHHHVLDEECLVLDGEMYFGDQLMRAGDFQLVPAGFDHTIIEAATDALLYQRGEVKLG